jgi:hypothetical protein
VEYDFIWGEIRFKKSYIYRDYILVKRFPILSNLVYGFIDKMSTLDTIVKDYDKNIMLRDCQRQAFEYLHNTWSFVTWSRIFGTTFGTLTEIESLQGPTTLYGRLVWHMLPVSTGCSLLVAPSVFSNVYWTYYCDIASSYSLLLWSVFRLHYCVFWGNEYIYILHLISVNYSYFRKLALMFF